MDHFGKKEAVVSHPLFFAYGRCKSKMEKMQKEDGWLCCMMESLNSNVSSRMTDGCASNEGSLCVLNHKYGLSYLAEIYLEVWLVSESSWIRFTVCTGCLHVEILLATI